VRSDRAGMGGTTITTTATVATAFGPITGSKSSAPSSLAQRVLGIIDAFGSEIISAFERTRLGRKESSLGIQLPILAAVGVQR
jgi:hypothetical protein